MANHNLKDILVFTSVLLLFFSNGSASVTPERIFELFHPSTFWDFTLEIEDDQFLHQDEFAPPFHAYVSLAYEQTDWIRCVVLGAQLSHFRSAYPLICVTSILPPIPLQSQALQRFNVIFRLIPEISDAPQLDRLVRASSDALRKSQLYCLHRLLLMKGFGEPNAVYVQLDFDVLLTRHMDELFSVVNETTKMAVSPNSRWPPHEGCGFEEFRTCVFDEEFDQGCSCLRSNWINLGLVVYRPSLHLWRVVDQFLEKLLTLKPEERGLILGPKSFYETSDTAIFNHLIRVSHSSRQALFGTTALPERLSEIYNFPPAACACNNEQSQLPNFENVAMWHFVGHREAKPWLRVDPRRATVCDQPMRRKWVEWYNLVVDEVWSDPSLKLKGVPSHPLDTLSRQIIDSFALIRQNRPPSHAGFRAKCMYRSVTDRRPFLVDRVDKIKAKQIAAACGADSARILAVGGLYDPIPWQSLPQSFALKLNHASGTNCLIFKGYATCDWQAPDRVWNTRLYPDRRALESMIKHWLQRTYSFLEWPFTHITPQWYVEELLLPSSQMEEYKLFMFADTLGAVRVIRSRTLRGGRSGDVVFVDADWKVRSDTDEGDSSVDAPETFDQMLAVARCLVRDLDHARIDFLEFTKNDHEGGPKRAFYFGEMVFSSMACETFLPLSLECELGSLWALQDASDYREDRLEVEDAHILRFLQAEKFETDVIRLKTKWNTYVDPCSS